MPQIILKNTETGRLRGFEPVDAREILQQKETIYEVPTDDEMAKMGPSRNMGARFVAGNPPPAGSMGKSRAEKDQGSMDMLNVAQLQGDDAEMQTGISADKYFRQDVVKASPGNVSTEQEDLTKEGAPQRRRAPEGGRTAERTQTTQGKALGKPIEQMNSAELRSALVDRGDNPPKGAKDEDMRTSLELATKSEEKP